VRCNETLTESQWTATCWVYKSVPSIWNTEAQWRTASEWRASCLWYPARDGRNSARRRTAGHCWHIRCYCWIHCLRFACAWKTIGRMNLKRTKNRLASLLWMLI